MKITTKSGFELDIDKEALDDWRVTESIADAASDDVGEQMRGVANLVKLIFGKQKKAYYNHVAAEHNGKIPNNVVNEDVLDIFDQLKESNDKEAKEVKNS